MFECREENCEGTYRTKHDDDRTAYCDVCESEIPLYDLRQEQTDHDIKESKENN